MVQVHFLTNFNVFSLNWRERSPSKRKDVGSNPTEQIRHCRAGLMRHFAKMLNI